MLFQLPIEIEIARHIADLGLPALLIAALIWLFRYYLPKVRKDDAERFNQILELFQQMRDEDSERIAQMHGHCEASLQRILDAHAAQIREFKDELQREREAFDRFIDKLRRRYGTHED